MDDLDSLLARLEKGELDQAQPVTQQRTVTGRWMDENGGGTPNCLNK